MTQGRVDRDEQLHNGASHAGAADDCGCAGVAGAIRRNIRVVNPRGLHPRIIDLFTKTAKAYASAVTISYGDAKADGKSVWDLIMLVVMPDSEVVLEVDGPDAIVAVEPLTEILASAGGEDYTI